MVIHAKKYRKLDQVYDEMNIKPGVVTGAVRKVFTPTGTLLKSLDDFEDGGVYICSGADALKKDQSKSLFVSKYSPAIFLTV